LAIGSERDVLVEADALGEAGEEVAEGGRAPRPLVQSASETITTASLP
jgi:hypothetical protein